MTTRELAAMRQRQADDATAVAPELSMVIPAYNEAGRIKPLLESLSAYLATPQGPEAEVIIVDDGSEDNTWNVVDEWIASRPTMRCLRHPRNRGKGAALRTGLLNARGRLLLFLDADAATSIDDERRLRDAIASGADLAVGSRLVSYPGVERHRPLRRRLAGRLFAALVRRQLHLPVSDTQCGFKLLKRDTVLPLIRDCVTDGYLFDVELLARAQRAGLKIAEVGVSWRDVPGSKIRLIRDSIGMWRGLHKLKQTLSADRSRVTNPPQSPHRRTAACHDERR